MSTLDGLRFAELTKELLDRSFCFSCGDDDLDDFFNNEAVLYREKLMGKTYCLIEVLTPEETNQSGKEYRIIVAFTVANDSLRIYDLPNNRRNCDDLSTPSGGKTPEIRLVLKITKVIRQYHAKLIRLLYQKNRII